MVSKLRETWWDWNPRRLRRLLTNAKSATDANAYGWSNTHRELIELKDKCKHLEAEVARLERLSNG